MLTGERRGGSARRGMTVLGKIPAVPKPINLPSQRLENRGLDPNVEIVPRGSVSWGAAGRSPPTSSSPWGSSSQSSSPPVASGPWGSGPKPGVPPGSSGGSWGPNVSRPSSAGSGTRPSSAGSIGQTQEALAAANAWGPATARPASASGVLGQAQSQPPVPRPRSAETRTLSAQPPALTRFADHANGPPSPASPAWGGAGTARKLVPFTLPGNVSGNLSNELPDKSEDSHSLHQPARFTLTRVDFPTLGSEKNPDLRPQQNKIGGSPAERPGSADGKGLPSDERPPPGPGGPYDDMPPTGPGGFGGQDRGPEGWRREGGPYGGHPGMMDGNWHRDGPPPPQMQQHGGGQHQPDTWRRDPGHGAALGGGPSDDNWRRGGPPVGPYGPPGPGRFPHDPSGFMHQQPRYGPGPGPGPYGRGGGPGPGPGGFGRHGEMYGNVGPFGRPGGAPPPRPGPPMGPGMYQGPVPYDNYYGPPGVPGPGYGNIDEREMMMLGMGGGPQGMYGNYPQGPPEPFGRFPHGGPGPGPRHMPHNNPGMMRDRNEGMGYEGEGYRENSKYKESSNFKEGGGFKDGNFGKEGGFQKESIRPASAGEIRRESIRPASAGEVRRVGHVMSSGSGNSGAGTDVPRPSSSRGGHYGSHRDWGAAASSDEPMDFSKPVFEEDVSSASPGLLSKQSSSVSRAEIEISPIGDDMKSSEHAKRKDPSQDSGGSEEKAKGWGSTGETKDGPVVHPPNTGTVSKSDSIQTWRQVEVEADSNALKCRVADSSSLETKDPVARKTVPSEESDVDKRPGKDGSSSGPPLRERSMGREHVFSPHGGRGGMTKRDSSSAHSNVAMATRVQHSFGGIGSISRSSVTNPSRVANSPSTQDAVVVEEPLSSPLHERHVSGPSSPSGSDGQRNSDKLRILKRVGDGPESPHNDIVHTSEIGHTEVPAASPTITEALTKEDAKPKSKPVASHDGEKEWRPKVPAGDSVVEVVRPCTSATSKAATPAFVTPSAGGVPTAVTDVSDKGGPEGAISSESYDYEAQRARMKEIAAQRARQLRKEEEERNKEQKAKALAKLEELNRRSSGAALSQPPGQLVLDEGSKEPPKVNIPQDEVETSPSEEVAQEGTVEIGNGVSGVSTPRGGVRHGRNEHGKRERVGDRKSNGRGREEHRVKIGFEENRELPKGRLSVSLSQGKVEPPLLPSPSQQPSPSQAVVPPAPVLTTSFQQPETQAGVLLETSAPQAAQVQQHIPSKAQDARHRGKQYSSQPKLITRQSHSAADVESVPVVQEVIPAADSTVKGSGWTEESPLDLDSKEVTLSLGAGNVNSEGGVAAFRKKKSKSSGRNKQKLEIVMPAADSSLGELNQGWGMGSSAPTDPKNEMGKSVSHATTAVDDDAKVVPLTTSVKDSVSQDLKPESATGEQSKDAGIESGGSDVGSLRSNGELPNKRSQRKPQPTRRMARDKGTSQDVRIADKPHGGEGMVWAPVRSPSGPHPNGPKGGFGVEATVEAVVEKKDEPPVVQQTARARRAELERYTPKPVVKQQAQQQEEMQQQQSAAPPAQNHGAETSNISVVVDVPQNSESVTEIKFGSEARQADNTSKHGRTHASWRQRGGGNERGSVPKETLPVQHVESADSGTKFHQPSSSHQTQSHQRNRPAPSTFTEQSRAVNPQHSRPAAVQAHRQQAPPFPMEKEPQIAQVNQHGRSASGNTPHPLTVPFNREHKAPQESVTPYQPPRPGSSQSSRGVDIEGPGPHEHVRSQRVNSLQMDRHHGSSGKFERDYHAPQERPAGHHQSRHNSRHHGAPNSHERDHLQGHSGVVHHQRSNQVNTGEGAPVSREKDQVSGPVHGAGQGSSASQSVHGHPVAPVLPERERSPVKHVNVQQPPRSPLRQRGRQQTTTNEREQTAPSAHPHHQSRYRQPGHEREHHREVTNAVHHQQQQRGNTDGHWQQTGVVAERTPPSDFSQPYQHPSRTSSQKSQPVTPSTDNEQAPVHSNQYSRSDTSNKPHVPPTGDVHKQPHYQALSAPSSQHHKPLHQGVSQGPKSENAHNSPHWNGERGGSPPAFRGRDHGHSRRGRFGSRGSGAGGRNTEFENRREQSSKQRPAMEAAGGAVPSQVGG